MFRNCSQRTYPARMGEEMRPNGLDVAVGRMAEGSDRLEVLLGGPVRGQDRQRQVDLYLRRCHGVCVAGWRTVSRKIRIILATPAIGWALAWPSLPPPQERRLTRNAVWLRPRNGHLDHGYPVDAGPDLFLSLTNIVNREHVSRPPGTIVFWLLYSQLIVYLSASRVLWMPG